MIREINFNEYIKLIFSDKGKNIQRVEDGKIQKQFVVHKDSRHQYKEVEK